MMFFWVWAPRRFVSICQCFRETYYLHLQGGGLQPWRWRQYVSPKRWHLLMSLHSTKTQNIIITQDFFVVLTSNADMSFNDLIHDILFCRLIYIFFNLIWFDVFTVVNMSVVVFWVLMLYFLVGGCQYFRGMYHLLLQVESYEMLVITYKTTYTASSPEDHTWLVYVISVNVTTEDNSIPFTLCGY
jgi:hypothetical protein